MCSESSDAKHAQHGKEHSSNCHSMHTRARHDSITQSGHLNGRELHPRKYHHLHRQPPPLAPAAAPTCCLLLPLPAPAVYTYARVEAPNLSCDPGGSSQGVFCMQHIPALLSAPSTRAWAATTVLKRSAWCLPARHHALRQPGAARDHGHSLQHTQTSVAVSSTQQAAKSAKASTAGSADLCQHMDA